MLGSGPLGQFSLGQGWENAAVAGQTLSTTVSLISGAATGEATATGATLTDVASVVSGAATGDATATGATLTDVASVVDGAASGEGTATGDTLTDTSSVVSGGATGDATANGSALITIEIIGGEATGEGSVDGVELTDIVFLIDGTAHGGSAGDIEASGSIVTVDIQILPGNVSATSLIYITPPIGSGVGPFGQTPTSSISRPEFVHLDGKARGKVITVAVELMPGEARTSSNTPESIVYSYVSLIPGTASGNATTGSAVIVLKTMFLTEDYGVSEATKIDNDFLLFAA